MRRRMFIQATTAAVLGSMLPSDGRAAGSNSQNQPCAADEFVWKQMMTLPNHIPQAQRPYTPCRTSRGVSEPRSGLPSSPKAIISRCCSVARSSSHSAPGLTATAMPGSTSRILLL